MSLRLTACGRLFMCALAALVAAGTVQAGHQFFRQNSVGGISIDAEGVLAGPKPQAIEMLRDDIVKNMKKVPGELNGQTEIRKISLKGLNAAIEDAVKNNLGVLPDEVKYLAGLQRIEYIFVYPEENDIVLAGPGEGWKVDEKGNVVGVTTGRPVIQLDDLLVALRTVNKARTEGISCSIDPTAEGRKRLDELFKDLKVFSQAVPKQVEEALGPQKITLTGVPDTSHFARVMVAADYRMKRYGMHLEPSPVKGMKSFIEMSNGRSGNIMPRWWLACNYDAVGKSEDGLAWQIRGSGVKAMTEEDFIAEDGTARGTGKTDPIAQKWADNFTEKYAELCKADIAFGELRNLMDMCVIAALIEREGLLEKSGCSIPMLVEEDTGMMIDQWNAPKSVATQSSALKKGRNWVITASGGVQIESWQAAEKQEVVPATKKLHEQSAAPEGRTQWWWN